MGCVSSGADATSYSLKTNTCFVFMLVFVDDILMFLDMKQGFDFVVGQFIENPETLITREIEKRLGFRIHGSEDTIEIHDATMIDHLIEALQDNCMQRGKHLSQVELVSAGMKVMNAKM